MMRDPNSCRLGIIILAVVLMMSKAGTEDVHASDDASARATSAGHVAVETDAANKFEDTEGAIRSLPIYVPPRRGKPRARIGGGVRSATAKLPTLQALVPDHVALTAKSKPTLLWHLNQLPPDRASLMFSLTSDDEIDPLIAVVLDRPTQAGLQRIDLTQYAFQLKPSREYQWSVALVTDFERRSRDVIIFGWIERVEESQSTQTHQASVPPSDLTAISTTAALAAAGLWYDAVDAASGTELAALLKQIALEPGDLH